MNNSILFIVGQQRSGTTLLRLMLTSHPKISIPPESRFIIESHDLLKKNDKLQILEALNIVLLQNKKFAEWNLNKKGLNDILVNNNHINEREIYLLIYNLYRKQYFPKANLIGDKNPSYLFEIKKLKRLFPQSRFLVLYRNPYAVFSSQKTAFVNWGSNNSPLYQTKLETSKIVSILKLHKYNKRFYFLKYETLISNPKAELVKICKWLTIDFDKNMLNYAKNADLIPLNRKEWHNNTSKEVEVNIVNKWKKKLSTNSIDVATFLFSKELKYLKYNKILRKKIPSFKNVITLINEFLKFIYYKTKYKLSKV